MRLTKAKSPSLLAYLEPILLTDIATPETENEIIVWAGAWDQVKITEPEA